jgi:hypothetical protein
MSLIDQAKIIPLDGLQTSTGKEYFYKGFENFTTNTKVLEGRGNTVLLLRKLLSEQPNLKDALHSEFARVKKHEDIFSSTNEWEEKTSEQIFFAKGGLGEMFNQIPGLIALLTFIKIWLAPAFGVASPLLLFILPYFMLVYVYKLQMPWSKYQSLVLDMLIGQNRSFNLNTVTKLLYFVFSLSQTVIQPFLTSIAVSKLDTLVRERAASLREISQATENILSIFVKAGIRTPKSISLTGDSYCVFADAKDSPWKIHYLRKIVGTAEVIYCLAANRRFKKPTWVSEISLEIHNFADVAIQSPKLSSVKYSIGQNHSLLTGPNRGGKSSSLRGILQNVLWAQSYGVTPSSYKACLFDWIDCSLRAEDRPGISSLFEREIEIATNILRRTEGNGLVLIDEIFHSTNPPDGEKTARLFLESLWERENIISCVSTHVYSIVESAPDSIKKLCCWAEEDEVGSITYSYELKNGICKVSSVIDVLKEKGFLTAVGN